MTDRRNYHAYRAITGGLAPTSEPSDFAGALAYLVRKVGSQERTAAALGIPRRTLRRWLSGENKPAPARRHVVQSAARQLVRRDRLTPKREGKVRAATMVIVKAVLRYGDEDGPRTMTFKVGGPQSLRLDAGAIPNAVDLFLNGATAEDGPWSQNEGIFAAIVDGMDQQPDGYADMFRDTTPDGLAFDVTSVRFK